MSTSRQRRRPQTAPHRLPVERSPYYRVRSIRRLTKPPESRRGLPPSAHPLAPRRLARWFEPARLRGDPLTSVAPHRAVRRRCLGAVLTRSWPNFDEPRRWCARAARASWSRRWAAVAGASWAAWAPSCAARAATHGTPARVNHVRVRPRAPCRSTRKSPVVPDTDARSTPTARARPRRAHDGARAGAMSRRRRG